MSCGRAQAVAGQAERAFPTTRRLPPASCVCEDGADDLRPLIQSDWSNIFWAALTMSSAERCSILRISSGVLALLGTLRT